MKGAPAGIAGRQVRKERRTMTRISTLAANEHLLDLLGRTRTRVEDLQVQVATGKKSQTYAGISADSRNLIDLETRTRMLEQFAHDNALISTRLNATSATVDGIEETIHTFRKLVLSVASMDPITAATAQDLQQEAFRTLKNVQDYLNTDLDGRYLFAGGQVRTQPFDLPYTSLEAFQSVYDGVKVVYPPTREGHVEMRGQLTHADTGDLTMTDSDAVGGGDTITAANVGSFAALRVGATITISGGDSGNDGIYTVVSIDPTSTSITIDGTLTNASGTIGTPPVAVDNSVIAGTTDTTATISIGNWYQGDNLTQTHRLDTEREFSSTLNATHAGFEKAIRALGLIAQGKPGTTGGLENNIARLDQALQLVSSGLDRASTGTPFGAELAGSLDNISMELGTHQSILQDTSALHASLTALFEQRIHDLEDTDETEAITYLLEGTRTLEASYQAMSRVQQLSLINYL
jgi:flagellin-like hook-associated protein FlgL